MQRLVKKKYFYLARSCLLFFFIWMSVKELVTLICSFCLKVAFQSCQYRLCFLFKTMVINHEHGNWRHILVFYMQCLNNHTKDAAQRSNWGFITFLGTFFLYQHHAQMHSNFDADSAKFFFIAKCAKHYDLLFIEC